jgi:hypothetical protein
MLSIPITTGNSSENKEGIDDDVCFLEEAHYKQERTKRALNRLHEENDAKSNVSSIIMQEAFSKLYTDCSSGLVHQADADCERWRSWGQDNDAGGMGSGPGASTDGSVAVRQHLPRLVSRFNISSMLDAACGSFHWMPTVLKQIEKINPDFKFYGVDIVPAVIYSARQKYPAKNFCVGDITAPNFTIGNQNFQSDLGCLETKKVDIIIARDVFFHLSYSKIKCAINNFSRSGSKYLLATTDPTASWADESITGILNQGGHRKINLYQPPLSFPESLDGNGAINYLFQYERSNYLLDDVSLCAQVLLNTTTCRNFHQLTTI